MFKYFIYSLTLSSLTTFGSFADSSSRVQKPSVEVIANERDEAIISLSKAREKVKALSKENAIVLEYFDALSDELLIAYQEEGSLSSPASRRGPCSPRRGRKRLHCAGYESAICPS